MKTKQSTRTAAGTSAAVTKVTPETVYQTLKARLTPRAHPNLENVHNVCAQIHQARGKPETKDYSPANIAKKLRASGLSPSYNTLNSPKGSHFKELIKAWADQDGASTSPHYAQPRPQRDDELLSKIADDYVRGAVAIRLAEHRKIQGLYDLLKSRLNLTVDMSVRDGTALAQGAADQPQIVAADPVLNPAERDALARALKRERLATLGVTFGESGELLIRGRVLFDPGFVPAYEKLLTFIAGAPEPAARNGLPAST